MLWLVGQLPDTSAFSASMRGGQEFRGWNLQNTLLAATVNLLYAANQQRGGKKSIKQLVKVPKPRVKRQPGRVMRVADVLARRKSASNELNR